MTLVLIRDFRPGDEPALWAVFFSAVRQTASRDYSPAQVAAWAPDTPDMARWTERMREMCPFVAERDGRAIGYASLRNDGYIDHFFVAADCSRQGVGSALMRHIHEQAATLNVERLFSEVSLTARPFFERWGFVVDAEQTVVCRDVEFINFRMSKVLGESDSTR